jgi:hypothetical protein
VLLEQRRRAALGVVPREALPLAVAGAGERLRHAVRVVEAVQRGLAARAQRPCEMGDSGLPSALTARPSRVRTFMPQPAGHSRQVVRYHVAMPGTISSCGTTYGISFSAPPVLHPVSRHRRR